MNLLKLKFFYFICSLHCQLLVKSFLAFLKSFKKWVKGQEMKSLVFVFFLKHQNYAYFNRPKQHTQVTGNKQKFWYVESLRLKNTAINKQHKKLSNNHIEVDRVVLCFLLEFCRNPLVFLHFQLATTQHILKTIK